MTQMEAFPPLIKGQLTVNNQFSLLMNQDSDSHFGVTLRAL